MGVQRKRLTKRRINNRRSSGHGKVEKKQVAVCSNCGYGVMPHRVCPNCGFYKGRKVIAKLV
jgi:large subunit ribosomal protein L32